MGTIAFQTNDSEKLVQLDSLYTVQSSITFSLQVRSGDFGGRSSFCVTHTQLQVFIEEIENLGQSLAGRVTLHDCDSDAFITLEGIKFGRIAVVGQVGGTHEDQFLRFRFETDQTILRPLQEQIRGVLAEFNDQAGLASALAAG